VLGPALALFARGSFAALRAEDFLGFTFAAGLVFCLGLVDDLFGLRAVLKLAVQIAAASIIVSLGWQFHTLRLPVEGSFELGVLAPVLSVVWIVGVTNAINFIDGLDGLAAGIVAIIGGSLLVLAVLQESPETVVVTSCIVGA
jgi:UDP-GlcNAc:undecaprenyl-phosphate GlcNAc-1-phosphate transferase